MAIWGHFILFDHFIHRIVFHAGDKVNKFKSPFSEQFIVIVATVIHHDSINGKFELAGHCYIRNLAVGNNGERREIAIMVQKQMQFYRSFSTPVVSPVKRLQTQIDNGGIQADRRVFKAKFTFTGVSLAAETSQEIEEDHLIQLPGTVLVGTSQGGMTGSADTRGDV